MKLDNVKKAMTVKFMLRVQRDLEGCCLKHLVELKKVYNHPKATLVKEAVAEQHKEMTGLEYNFQSDYKSNYNEAREIAQGNMRSFIIKMEGLGESKYSESEYQALRKEYYGDKKLSDFDEQGIRTKLTGQSTVFEGAEKILMKAYLKLQKADLTVDAFQENHKEERSKRLEVEASALDIFKSYLDFWEKGGDKAQNREHALN